MKAKGFFKKNLYYFLMGGAMLTAAVVITLVLTLGGSPVLPPDDPDDPVVVTPITFVIPVESSTLGRGYSDTTLVYSSTLKEYAVHMGIDFKVPAGTQVVAAYEGTVESVYESPFVDGNVVVIAHKDGLKTVYKSLDSNILVTEGQKVAAGQAIGSVSVAQGAEKKEGSHLHFEVLLDGEEVDPVSYMPDLEDK